MRTVDQEYTSLIRDIISDGVDSNDRTGVGTKSLFGKQIKVDVRDSFPILTLKSVYFKAVIHELIWFISGSTNIKYLQDNGIKIWNEWADENGELGPVYGKQWRDSNGVDQLQYCINELKTNPTNRRLIVDSWRPDLLPDPSISPKDNVVMGKQALPPCHYSFQFNSDGKYIDLMWNQRSVDTFLGLPFNISSYALLLHMVGNLTSLTPRYLVGSLGNVHIYNNHFDQVNELLARDPVDNKCELMLNENIKNISDYTYDDIMLIGYKSLGPIKAPIAI